MSIALVLSDALLWISPSRTTLALPPLLCYAAALIAGLTINLLNQMAAMSVEIYAGGTRKLRPRHQWTRGSIESKAEGDGAARRLGRR